VTAGADEEFATFYSLSFAKVVRLVRPLADGVEEAEDLTQEAFARGYLRWDTLRGYGDPEAWVKTVAVNLACSRLRRLRTAARHRLERPTARVRDEAAEAAVRVDLVRALRRLPPKQRSVVVLHYFDGLPLSAIAQHLGTSEGTVKSNLHHARKKLAGLLEARAA
jgi:RNA polymerase sigma-70 factor (ECF subfamily)